MLKSMTGYGKAVCELPDKNITVELKSLNGKQADVYLRLPNLYREKESEIRNIIINSLKRGKIECVVTIERFNGEQIAIINKEAVKHYYTQLSEIRDELKIQDKEPLIQAILRLPESLKAEKEELDEKEWEELKSTLYQSIEQLENFRQQEGNILENDIIDRIGNIEKLLSRLDAFENTRTERIRERLKNNLSEFFDNDGIDKNRFEQELIYYIEKLDITEEKVRLKNHCSYFIQVATEDNNIGKKLGFICQEIGREINTIGAKANDFEIQKIVVLMKDELEKIKEQLMNVI
ncbi:MAG TPA: YicC/YloC family endoribonuclease [Bacteroidales bacterium]|nr:YicC/YloC family endoribonuclease [Bacteroidales bacterium]